MTKAIVCIACMDIRMLRPSGPVSCECGNVTGQWIDARAGSCRIVARQLHLAALMGLNNMFLGPGLETIRDAVRGDSFTPEDGANWRALHRRATKAPAYFFDESRRDCWAILMGPKDSVTGVTWEERNGPH